MFLDLSLDYGEEFDGQQFTTNTWLLTSLFSSCSLQTNIKYQLVDGDLLRRYHPIMRKEFLLIAMLTKESVREILND